MQLHVNSTTFANWRHIISDSPMSVPADTDSNSLKIPSSWFRRFRTPVFIREHSPSASVQSFSSSTAKDLFTADIPIIVINPLSTPLSTVLSSPSHLPMTHPNVIFVLTSTPSSHLPHLAIHPARTLVIDPQRALTAIQTLAENPSSAIAVQRYQDDFAASKISSISEAIDDILSQYSMVPSTPTLVALRLHKARYIVKSAIAMSETALGNARKEVDDALGTVSEIRGRMEEVRVRVPREVLGVDGEGEVQEAVKKAKKDVAVTMDGLKWWKMIWRVDDIRHIVGAAVERAWCRDLERDVCESSFLRLIFCLTSSLSLGPFVANIPHWQSCLSATRAHHNHHLSSLALLFLSPTFSSP